MSSSTPASSQPKPLPFYAQFTAGAIAGVTELLCLYPLDVVKTRMQLQGKAAVAGAEHYNGMMDAFRKIIASEGYVFFLFFSFYAFVVFCHVSNLLFFSVSRG